MYPGCPFSTRRASKLARSSTTLTLAAVITRCIWPAVALAASPADKAAAEALFQEGKALVAERKFAEACPKFVESQRLDPGLGTLLFVADCYEENGETASAWATFREAEAELQKAHDPRVTIARDRALRLEPKLSRLVISTKNVGSLENLSITRDGTPLGRPLLNTALPLDPGSHTVRAVATGRRAWETTVSLPRSGGTLTLTIPPLEPAVDSSAPAAGATPTRNGTPQRVVGFSLGAIGIAGVTLGTVFGLKAKSSFDDSEAHCRDLYCDATGLGLRSDMREQASISTASFIAAGLLVTAGTVLVLSAPSKGAAPLGLTLGPKSATLVGAF